MDGVESRATVGVQAMFVLHVDFIFSDRYMRFDPCDGGGTGHGTMKRRCRRDAVKAEYFTGFKSVCLQFFLSFPRFNKKPFQSYGLSVVRLQGLPSPSVGRAASRRLRTLESGDSDGDGDENREDDEHHDHDHDEPCGQHLTSDIEKQKQQQLRRQWHQLNQEGEDHLDADDADVMGMLKHLPSVFLQDVLADR